MNFGYIFKKIGILVILLIISAVLVIGKFTAFPLYALFDAYLRFALYVIVIGILSHFFPYVLPKRYSVEKGAFSCFAWEKNGKFYDEAFKVTKWKDSSMEASKIFAKKETKETKEASAARSAQEGKQASATAMAAMKNGDSLMAMIQGTCISELVHWILILLSPLLLVLIQSWLRWPLWVLYIFFNLKDVVIQRYNRPRFVRLYERVTRKEKEK